jgi:hypothetical protein
MENEYLYFKLLNEQLSLEGEYKKGNNKMGIEVINEEGNFVGKVKNVIRLPKIGDTILLNGCHVVKSIVEELNIIKIYVYNKVKKNDSSKVSRA